MLSWNFFPQIIKWEKHKLSSSQDLTFLCVADIRWNNSHEVIAQSYCDEALPNARESTLTFTIASQPKILLKSDSTAVIHNALVYRVFNVALSKRKNSYN